MITAERIAWVFLVVMLGCIAVMVGIRMWAPRALDLTPDSNGMIHHPKYGVYPAVVPYRKGMIIYPGQTATLKIPLYEQKAPKWDDEMGTWG